MQNTSFFYRFTFLLPFFLFRPFIYFPFPLYLLFSFFPLLSSFFLFSMIHVCVLQCCRKKERGSVSIPSQGLQQVRQRGSRDLRAHQELILTMALLFMPSSFFPFFLFVLLSSFFLFFLFRFFPLFFLFFLFHYTNDIHDICLCATLPQSKGHNYIGDLIIL